MLTPTVHVRPTAMATLILDWCFLRSFVSTSQAFRVICSVEGVTASD